MARTDTVKIQRVYTNPSPEGTTLGVEERITLGAFADDIANGAAALGRGTTVLTQTAPAAAAVPFADLTAAANSFNALRTALIAAKVLV